MTMIQNLYYAIWANLSELSVIIRAAIVLAVLVVFVWVIVRPLFLKLLSLLLRLAGLFTQLICLTGSKILGVTAGKSPEQYAARYNRMAERLGRCNACLLKWSGRLAGKHKFYLRWMLVLYGVLILLIGLPTFLEPVIQEEYIPYFSFASDLYQRAEAPTLEAAASYSPLFSSKSDVTVEEPPAAEDAGSEEDVASEVWLSLSKQGRNGANVRSGPGKNNQVLDIVEDDMQMLYLEEQSGRWVHIRTAGGIEGWIHDSLVTGVPDEDTE